MSAMTYIDTDAPRVWLGCLACYNGGDLIGEWMSPADAAEATPAQLHLWWESRGITETNGGHEELWVMDHEHCPLTGEFGPDACQSIADAFETVGESQWPAYLAYSRTGLGGMDGAGVSDPSDFEEAYCGEWKDREEYAYDLAESCGWVDSNEWPASYIDWERAARDLFMDYADEPAPGGGIYVFRSF